MSTSDPTPSAYPGLSFPAYYEINGKPAVIKTGGMLPLVLENGAWVGHYDPPKFRMDAERITEDEFHRLVRVSTAVSTPPLRRARRADG